METVFTESTLSDSFIYGMYNRNSEFMNIIINGMKKGSVIDKSFIENQIGQIERTRVSPLVPKVLKAFENGDIVLMKAPNDVKIPQSLPFFVTKINNKIRAIIFINNYGKLTKPDIEGRQYLDTNFKDLYTLMEAAMVAQNYHDYSHRLTKNLGLMKMCCSLYVSMMVRIMNKAYAIMNEFDLFDEIVYSISKFFLERVWMSTSEELNHAYAISNVRAVNGGRGINIAAIDEVNRLYDENKISNIDDLINFIATLSPRMKGISTRIFFQTYINTYKVPTIFSMEVLPYFLFTVEATMIGSYIVNRDLIMDVIKITKGIDKFYPELSKAII